MRTNAHKCRMLSPHKFVSDAIGTADCSGAFEALDLLDHLVRHCIPAASCDVCEYSRCCAHRGAADDRCRGQATQSSAGGSSNRGSNLRHGPQSRSLLLVDDVEKVRCRGYKRVMYIENAPWKTCPSDSDPRCSAGGRRGHGCCPRQAATCGPPPRPLQSSRADMQRCARACTESKARSNVFSARAGMWLHAG